MNGLIQSVRSAGSLAVLITNFRISLQNMKLYIKMKFEMKIAQKLYDTTKPKPHLVPKYANFIKEYAKKSLSESAPARRRRRKPKGSAGGGGSEGPADADGKALVTEGLGLGNDPLDRGYPAQLPRRAKSRRSNAPRWPAS